MIPTYATATQQTGKFGELDKLEKIWVAKESIGFCI